MIANIQAIIWLHKVYFKIFEVGSVRTILNTQIEVAKFRKPLPMGLFTIQLLGELQLLATAHNLVLDV
jgi:hypothetical protein